MISQFAPPVRIQRLQTSCFPIAEVVGKRVEQFFTLAMEGFHGFIHQNRAREVNWYVYIFLMIIFIDFSIPIIDDD
jgi:hypothetical protein